MKTRVIVSLCLGLMACGDDASPDFDGGPNYDGGPPADVGPVPQDRCGAVRAAEKIFFGTHRPEVIPLSEGQVLAIGAFGGCTGTFITDEWVITAAHCGIEVGREFCMGETLETAEACFTVDRVESHADSDMTLAHVNVPASTLLPNLVSIPVMTEALDASWLGTLVEAAGFGRQEDEGFNEREFTAEPIVDLTDFNLTIDGEGRHGVCFGDSGGPVIGIANDGSIRVFGDLSGGDPSCTGRDNFARADVVIDWIEGITGPTPEPGGCGVIDGMGQCNGNMAIWCEGDERRTEDCSTCGWSTEARGYRCITGADPCEGLSARGDCDGDTARWCDHGRLVSRDCNACGQACNSGGIAAGAYCIDDPCFGIPTDGRCEGDIAVHCRGGEVERTDCSARGGCDYTTPTFGYFCIGG